MSAKRRDLIKDYLVAHLRGSGRYTHINSNVSGDPEALRDIRFRDIIGNKYLLTVHATTSYRKKFRAFIQKQNIASEKAGEHCITIYDDMVFRKDFLPETFGRRNEVRLNTLELSTEKMFGCINYFNSELNQVDVYKFEPVTRDYSNAELEIIRNKGMVDLKTVKIPDLKVSIDDFFIEPAPKRVKLLRAKFSEIPHSVENVAQDRQHKQRVTQGTQLALF